MAPEIATAIHKCEWRWEGGGFCGGPIPSATLQSVDDAIRRLEMHKLVKAVLTCIFHKTSKFSRPTRVWG
jgi:hypothetical protein